MEHKAQQINELLAQSEHLSDEEIATRLLQNTGDHEFAGSPTSVFYVTDRKPTSTSNVNTKYGADRNAALQYGKAMLTPKSGMPAQSDDLIESDKKSTNACSDMGLTVNAIPLPGPLGSVFGAKIEAKPYTSRQEFWKAVKERMQQKGTTQILIPSHGYNNSFAMSVGAAAAFGHLINAVVIEYSWPAQAESIGYIHDCNNALWSAITHYRDFLVEAEAEVGAQNITLGFHSKSVCLAEESLARRAELYEAAGKPIPQFKQIVVYAGDTDKATYAVHGAMIARNAKSTIAYGSTNDNALKLSKKVNGGYERLGFFGDKHDPPEIAGMSWIDVTNIVKIDNGMNHAQVFWLITQMNENGKPTAPWSLEPRRGGTSPWSKATKKN